MSPDARLGTAPATGGGGSTADLELTIEDVEKIGQNTAALNETAQAARTRLSEAAGGGNFSSYPSAQVLYQQHQAVVEIFDKTLAAMTTDIEDFGNTIVKAAHNHDQTDNDVLATLALIAAKVDTTQIADAKHNARQGIPDEIRDSMDRAGEDLDTSSEIDAFGDRHDDVKNSSLDGLRPEHAAAGPAPDHSTRAGEAESFELPGGNPS